MKMIKLMNRRGLVFFRFNMVEVALALVILAIGLSSVMVLFPVGLKASRSSIADNNLGDIAERMAAYVQAKYTSREMWDAKGEGKTATDIADFESDVPSDEPKLDKFTSKVDGMDGLLSVPNNTKYFLYRQYSDASKENGGNDEDRAVDFEAMIRVGWDKDSLEHQYYPLLEYDNGQATAWKRLGSYARSPASGVTDPGSGRMKASGSDILTQCCKALIIEISWPADVEWANREKRIFRVEIFNENFVPYPQTTP